VELTFEWDAKKAENNVHKHKVRTAFDDPLLSPFSSDPDYSVVEQRTLNIGRSVNGRILVVIHTEREHNIRIISCRKATRRERI